MNKIKLKKDKIFSFIGNTYHKDDIRWNRITVDKNYHDSRQFQFLQTIPDQYFNLSKYLFYYEFQTTTKENSTGDKIGILMKDYQKNARQDFIFKKMEFYGKLYKKLVEDTYYTNDYFLEGICFEFDKVKKKSIFIGKCDGDYKPEIGTIYKFEDVSFTKYKEVTYGTWDDGNVELHKFTDFDENNKYHTYQLIINEKERLKINKENISKIDNNEKLKRNIKEDLILKNLYNHYFEDYNNSSYCKVQEKLNQQMEKSFQINNDDTIEFKMIEFVDLFELNMNKNATNNK